MSVCSLLRPTGWQIVNVMQLCGKRFSERADKNGVSDAFRRQIVTLYKCEPNSLDPSE